MAVRWPTPSRWGAAGENSGGHRSVIAAGVATRAKDPSAQRLHERSVTIRARPSFSARQRAIVVHPWRPLQVSRAKLMRFHAGRFDQWPWRRRRRPLAAVLQGPVIRSAAHTSAARETDNARTPGRRG